MNLNLFDIVEKEKWQKMQDGFSNALGICIQTVDLEAVPLPDINNSNQFCMDMINEADKNVKSSCKECLKQLINNIRKDKGHNYHICSVSGGLYLYGIPIGIEQEITLAYVIVGPVIVGKKKSREEYNKIAEENNIETDYLMKKITALKSFSFNSIDATAELLHEVTHYIVQLNYDIKKLKKRFTVPGTLDNVINNAYSSAYVEEFLNALLEASLHTTKSYTGSIMVLDENKNELTIKFSRGLTSEITKNTRVKIGEGISGVVARDRRPLLINDAIHDSEIKGRLKRPNIKSSIVYPLEVKDRLLGVMNINDTGTTQRFNLETLDLINSLSNLAAVALAMFPKTAA